ncbi:F-box/LRR-repeat protein 5-like isoform X2 [Homarus americanus]|uniref:F-box/LRR-repeat protein 5-like isoform X2 n=1 Tax=Homarus americanus TaxID=6706 RepID=UPI001C444AF1|nr:F-box/LRR-repeat protein 5-like isoform X2 [Homarus americanus]
MAPRVPDEIDVFTAPHSRMKELVNIYTQKMQCVDFRDGPEVLSLLQDLNSTLYEFKSHESIENIFIMDQLKNRLKQRQIINSAVCDCHNDNRLADVVQLVRTGTQVRERSIGERVSFGLKLQETFEEFVRNFLPHMEEEEQVFQPLLVEYFDYDELKILKEVVLKEHELVKERQSLEKAQEEEEPETSGIVKDLRDLDWDLCSLADDDYCRGGRDVTPREEPFADGHHRYAHPSPDPQYLDVPPDTSLTETLDVPSPQIPGDDPSRSLPAEILVEIFQYLTPPDLGRCAQACLSWNDAAFSPSLWTAIYPVQWARGIWSSEDVGLSLALEDAASDHSPGKWDEDADVDEAEEERDPLADKEHFILESLVNWVLPRAGAGVSTIVVDAGQGITSRLLHHALVLCPNLTTLSAAHTQIDCYSFKGLWLQGSLRRLCHLDLQGCDMIDDLALHYLAQCGSSGQYPGSDVSNYPGSDVSNYPGSDVSNYPGPDVSNYSSTIDVNRYCEVPEVINYCDRRCSEEEEEEEEQEEEEEEEQEEEEEEVWTAEAYQLCGYCRCWCSHVDGLPLRANLQPWENSYSGGNPCQVVKKRRSLGRGRGKRSSCLTKDATRGHPSRRTLPPSPPSQQVERDIEEICCYPRNYTSWQPLPGNVSYRPQGSARGDKQTSGNYTHDLQLVTLSLSGCWQVTDDGLLAMVDAGLLDSLRSIDVSGCYQLTGEGLETFADACANLRPENLWYCDNIQDGPYPALANGCANLCNPVRVCCRSGR